MSESSSDTESSCGWTVISNEGSDIETLGPEIGAEYDQEDAAGSSTPKSCTSPQEEGVVAVEETCLDTTLKEEETLLVAESGTQMVTETGSEDHVTLCSSSDHSDIITIGDSKAAELGVWEGPDSKEDEDAGNEELYLGTSSSSHYTFSAAETILPAEHLVRRGSNSSSTEDDESKTKAGPQVRRRRLRKSTTGSEPDEQQENKKETEDLEEVAEQREARVLQQRENSRTLNKCILLTLLIAISMGFGHFYGTVQVQKRQLMEEKICVTNPIETQEILHGQKEHETISKDVVTTLREDLEEKQDLVMSLTGIMDKITKENQHLRAKEAELQVQRQDLLEQLQQARSETESRQKHLASENRALKNTLEREEASLLGLQNELRRLRDEIHELEEKGAGTDSENQQLKSYLLEEKQRIRGYLNQKEVHIAEAQALRNELDEERKVTDKLREDLEEMSLRESEAQGGGEDLETEDLQIRLQELEKKLSFEQQRSDLWERLYVESKEGRTKGDSQPKTGASQDGMMGKVTETFDAVKNSTKEFVHHHKEQIKKAKEAVKENLRKFSDSVKSTFRHLKDSTSSVFDRIRRPQDKRFNERKDANANQQESQSNGFNQRSSEEHWHHHQPPHQHPRKSTLDSSFQSKKEQTEAGRKTAPKGCTGVFDCAYQESMSLFNKAMEPIRADEFHKLLRNYLHREVGHFHHWRELDDFINNFFHDGLFIHDQMLFTDFVSGVENYLEDMDEYQGGDDVFEDLDDYIYRHFFGETYSQQYGPSSVGSWSYFECSEKGGRLHHCEWEPTF